ncbi:MULTISPECIES: class I SAM-dependent methyltransferase [unclassified Pseudomonas]|uniref:class I SAM-dependent methyltransferase n=1 Tax=Pseudomonas TaxID=286 RepID=UPI000A1F4CA8|nr:MULTISPECIES: class I SAM-dependent methyltransferase [unclassified Pseudomonas]MCH4902529.1 methyltransferase domain-containing protein [Pseudomonas sp. B707]PNA07359.1 methyltransferase domain-containing protein [Pseudomonas sp. FW305-BF15]PNB82138.1 methyltransferase domain-containing protein [Pseudomonas sp. FW305-BF6]TEA60820.1 methyltransferase domain-containing protein [Pseudomonas sp. CH235]
MRHELYRVTDLPVLQNRTFADPESAKASARADMLLVQDERSGLIFNAAFDADKLSYDADYQNEQAHSGQFQKHLSDVEGIIARHFKGQELIEVGCGKGYFLELLKGLGYRITGIDPAYEGENADVIKAPFTRGLGLEADAIVLRHVLEHIQDPLGFLAVIAEANQGGGQIYIEVPCFDWILEHRAWFDLFYEHVNYFRLDDLRRMFGTVHEAGHLFGGQYLYIVADLATLRLTPEQPVPRLALPDDFTASLERAVQIIQGAPEQGSAIWGASSKGVIYSLFLQRAGVAVDRVVDINPAKQGRYLPLSGARVSSPQEAMDALPEGANLFVMNSNYLEEIKRMTGGRYVYHAVDSASFQ